MIGQPVLAKAGIHVTRYALALILLWIGAMKFTGYEAQGIQPFVANSPFMSWMYAFGSVQAVSNLIGVIEVAVGIMIALRPISALVSAAGSLLAAGIFVVTLTFLFTTPGWEPSLGGFPALAVVPGQFVLKDLVLLGAALWTAAEALVERRVPSFSAPSAFDVGLGSPR